MADEKIPSVAYIPLSGGVMAGPDGRERARAVFDDVAEVYDRARPSYPERLIETLRVRVGLDRHSRLVEVGCGTGQLTRALARTGCALRAIELGPRLVAVARRNLSTFQNVTVEVGSFEEAAIEGASVDLVVSGTAFHWIDPAVAYRKAADALVPDGHLALLTNAHVRGGTQQDLAEDIQGLQERIAPEIGRWVFQTADDVRSRAVAGGDIAAMWYRVERDFEVPPAVDEFLDAPEVATQLWTETYDRDRYLDMLATQSPYALLEPERRLRLLDAIGALVDRKLDGTVTKDYLAVMAIARRR